MEEKKHEHVWTLAFTGLVNGVKSYSYHCRICDEWKKTNDPLKPEETKGYYEGNPLTKI